MPAAYPTPAGSRRYGRIPARNDIIHRTKCVPVGDMLKTSSDNLLPLELRILSPTMINGRAVYTCQVTSRQTGQEFQVHHHYSDFRNFALQIQEDWTCHEFMRCNGACEAIQDFLRLEFPSRLWVLSNTRGMLRRRRQSLEQVFTNLLRIVLRFGNTMMCLHARQHLPTNLFDFLGVTESQCQRSLVETYIDGIQPKIRASSISNASTVSATIDLPTSNQTNMDCHNDTCVVCYDNLEDENDVVTTLKCGHAFHRSCVFEWLKLNLHCPICRVPVVHSLVAVCCRPRGRIIWWLDDYEKSLLDFELKQVN